MSKELAAYRKIVDERVFSTKNEMPSDSKRKYHNSKRKAYPLPKITPTALNLSKEAIQEAAIVISAANWAYLNYLEEIRINQIKNIKAFRLLIFEEAFLATDDLEESNRIADARVKTFLWLQKEAKV